MRRRTFSANQCGVALVETVIALPVLIFLMMAAAEVANIFVQHSTLTKLTRDGARYVTDSGKVLNTSSGAVALTPALIAETQSFVVYGDNSGSGTALLNGLTMADVAVAEVAPQIIEVSATYAHTGILGAVLPGVGGGAGTSLSINLRATVSMRAL